MREIFFIANKLETIIVPQNPVTIDLATQHSLVIAMKILTASSNDIDELIELIQYSFRGDKGLFRDDHLLEGTRVTRQMLEKDLSTPTGVLWKCVDDSKNGNNSIMAAVYSEKEVDTNMMYVGRLCVHPDYQTRGIGKQLMAAVKERARSLNCCAITLKTIIARQDLIKWYQTQGFVLTGEREALEEGVYGTFLVAPELLDLVTLQKVL